MKHLVRSKSDTNFFSDKKSLDVINSNLKKIKYQKHKNKEVRKTARKTSGPKLTDFLKSGGFGVEKKSSCTFSDNLGDSSFNADELNEDTFKKYIRSVFSFQYKFNKKYLDIDIYDKKIYINQLLQITLIKLKKFKTKQIQAHIESNASLLDESIYESPLSVSRYDARLKTNLNIINSVNILREKFERLENILEIFILTSPQELFREVKTIILKEYDQTCAEIESYLELNRKDTEYTFFMSISQTVLFLISRFTVLLDYYSMTTNSLVDKLNRFFIVFFENASKYEDDGNNNIIKCCDLIYKYIKLKKEYIKEFCQNNEISLFNNPDYLDNEAILNSKFTYNKFNSFGLYLFNNLYGLLDKVPTSSSILSPLKKVKFREENPITGKKIKDKISAEFSFKTLALYSDDRKFGYKYDQEKLSKVFKWYFTSKMAVWKYISVQGERIEICRMCENRFNLNEYILHVVYCKYHEYYYNKIHILNSELTHLCEQLKTYKEKLFKESIEGSKLKDCLFSPKSELNQRFRTHLIEKTPKLPSRGIYGGKKNENEMELLDIILGNLIKEKEFGPNEYEKNPQRISQLISIIHFTVIIFNQNINGMTFSNDINKMFSKLLIILMKKLKQVENILTLSDNQEKAKNKTMSHHFRKLTISNVTSPYLGHHRRNSNNNRFDNFKKQTETGRSFKKLTNYIDEKKDKFKMMSNTNLKKVPLANNNLNSLLFNKETRNSAKQVSGTKKEVKQVNVNTKMIKQVRNQLMDADSTVPEKIKPFKVSRNNNFHDDSEIMNNVRTFQFKIENSENSDDTNTNSSKYNTNEDNTDTKEFNNYEGLRKSLFNHQHNRSSSKFSNCKTILFSPGKMPTTNFINFGDKIQMESISVSDDNNIIKIIDKNGDVDDFFNHKDFENNDHFIGENLDNSDDSGLKYEIDSQFDEIIDLIDELDPSEDKNFSMTIIKDEIENDSSNSIHSIEIKEKEHVKISDFKFLKPIVEGGYGRVDIYQKISTKDIFAIKTVNIEKMKLKNVGMKSETLILQEVDNEYVVKCFYIFSDKINYYFVMEFMPGGDLLSLLNHLFLRPETIQLIVAEMILALEYLHSINIIHRDIKPENIVISKEGHIKLTDFGLSEAGLTDNKYAVTDFDPNNMFSPEVTNKKILGTENYLAPELIKNEEITFASDYWSLGVLIYELFTNKLPFTSQTQKQTFANILSCNISWEPFDEISKKFPTIFSNLEPAKDLINKFLEIDQYERWSYEDMHEIKSHRFFKNFDWNNSKNIKNNQMMMHLKKRNEELKKPVENAVDPSLIHINAESVLDLTIECNQPRFSTKRVDILFKKCMEVLKNKTNMNTDDKNFTNMMLDMD